MPPLRVKMTQGNSFQETPLSLHLFCHTLHVGLEGHVLPLELLDVIGGSIHCSCSGLGDLLHGDDLCVAGDPARHLFFHPVHGVSAVDQLFANLVELGVQ